MKLVKLLHNPGAGDEHTGKEKLEALINGQGFECRYSSTKKEGWETIDGETDIIAVAGGDGTVRKAAQVLLQRRILDKKFPLGILPMGTANNVAQTLGITGDEDQLLKSWHNNNRISMDAGRLWGVEGEEFFIESFGYGIFPQLIKDMTRNGNEALAAAEKLQLAAEKFNTLINEYEAKHCELFIDGTDYSGRFLMVEVMNIKALGPNLELAPRADVSDGLMEVVMVPESRREEFAAYMKSGKQSKSAFDFYTVQGKEISMIWQNGLCHADDQLIKLGKQSGISITVLEGVLEFLI